MSTRMLLAVTAVVMGVCGVTATFLPHELLTALGTEPVGPLPLLVQLLGALLFAFAMANWTAKGAPIGGIYNRPLALGNVTHFVIGALALGRAVTTGGGPLVVAAAVYSIFAVAFVLVLFRSPVPAEPAPRR